MNLDDVLAGVAREHGVRFTVRHRAAEGQSGDGAYFADDEHGRPVVLKWFPDETVVHRYALVVPTLDALRHDGYPIPRYGPVLAAPGCTLVAQEVVPGTGGRPPTAAVVARVLTLNRLQADRSAPPLEHGSWGGLIVHSLVTGEDGYAMHEPLRRHSARAAEVLARVEAVGADTRADALPTTGIVHYDLHGGNLLVDDAGALVAVVDWDGASAGDHRFDLVLYAHHLTCTGHADLARPVWDAVETDLDASVLRAYVAHIVLRLVDWQIRHNPSDVTNQLDVGEALLTRYA